MDSNSFWKFYLICCRVADTGLRSGVESEAVRWSRIPYDTRGRGRIFCPTVQLDHFYITLLSWEFLLNRYNFLWNFCWNIILAVYHDFHWVLVATKLLAAKLHSLYVKESEWEIWKVRSWSRNFERVGVGVRHFTSDSATLDAILEWWPLLAWPWWCNRKGCNRDFLTDHKFSMGLRSGEFPDQSITFNSAFWKSSLLFLMKDSGNILEFSSTIWKCLAHIWNGFSLNYINVFV